MANMKRLAQAKSEVQATHWDGCWKEPKHHPCAVAMILRQSSELQEAAMRESVLRAELEMRRDPEGA